MVDQRLQMSEWWVSWPRGTRATKSNQAQLRATKTWYSMPVNLRKRRKPHACGREARGLPGAPAPAGTQQNGQFVS